MIPKSAYNSVERLCATLESGKEQEIFEYGRRFSAHLDFPTEERVGPGIFDEVNARVQEFKERIPLDHHLPRTAAFALGVIADVCSRLENGEQL